jgi:hypothetical protein
MESPPASVLKLSGPFYQDLSHSQCFSRRGLNSTDAIFVTYSATLGNISNGLLFKQHFLTDSKK